MIAPATIPLSTHSKGGHFSPEMLLYQNINSLDVLAACGKTFHAASRVLPQPVRNDLADLYAFCRLVDDCGDAASICHHGPHYAAQLLKQIESCLEGSDDNSPIVRRFRKLSHRHNVPLLFARQLIEGVRSDLGIVRFETEADLVRYSYAVASTVGLMMCRILRVEPQGDPFAIDLGIAMQLTNIARDVAEDASIGRVYLPASWIDPHVVLAGHDTAQIARSVERVLKLADTYYNSADSGMRFLPLSVRPGIRAAASNYRAIGEVIRRNPQRAATTRVSTRHSGKLCRTGVSCLRAVCDSAVRLRIPTHDIGLHTALNAAMPRAGTV